MTQTISEAETRKQQLRDSFAVMGISEEILKGWDACKVSLYQLKELGKTLEQEKQDKAYWEEYIRGDIEKLTLRNAKRRELSAIGVAEAALQEWDKLDIPTGTLDKMQIPTPEELREWESLPKGQSQSLKKVKHPILCNWTIEEVIQAMRPAIERFISKYSTNRTVDEECWCLGAYGIFQALSTDAGIAPFFQYAQHRARTSIRRVSATSQVVKETEKRPSKTEVKREITTWLRGTFLEAECDRLATNEVNVFRSSIEHRNDHFKDYCDIQSMLISARLSEVDDPQIQECIQKAEALLESIPKTAEINMAKLSKKIAINQARIVGVKDLVSQRIQKLGYSLPSTSDESTHKGKNYATMLFVREGYPLSRLSATRLNGLCNYLNHRFNPHSNKMPHLISEEIRSNLKTVADLVNAIAVPPDFQRMPKPVHVSMADDVAVEQHPKLKGGGPGNELCAAYSSAHSPFADPKLKLDMEDKRQSFRETMAAIRSRIILTPSQEMVMIESLGMDGNTMKDGSFVANNYGKLLLIHKVQKLLKEVNLSEFTSEILCKNSDFLDGLRKAVQNLNLPADLAKAVETAISEKDDAIWKSEEPRELKTVSRQRITQYLKAITGKYQEALFEAHFVNVPNPKLAINSIRENIVGQPTERNPNRLTKEEDEILCWLYGLKGTLYSFDDIAKDLDCFYDAAKNLSFEKRKSLLNDIVQRIKEKLLQAYY